MQCGFQGDTGDELRRSSRTESDTLVGWSQASGNSRKAAFYLLCPRLSRRCWTLHLVAKKPLRGSFVRAHSPASIRSDEEQASRLMHARVVFVGFDRLDRLHHRETSRQRHPFDGRDPRPRPRSPRLPSKSSETVLSPVRSAPSRGIPCQGARASPASCPQVESRCWKASGCRLRQISRLSSFKPLGRSKPWRGRSPQLSVRHHQRRLRPAHPSSSKTPEPSALMR